MLAPARIVGEQPDRREALLLLADALERLVAAGRREQREALELALVVEQVRPNTSRRCAGSLNGASARNTNRHLGQSRHQDAARSAGSIRKIALQLVKAGWYASSRANARAIASSEAGRSTEKICRPPATSATAACSRRSARRPLLNWWLTSMPSQARFPLEAERSLAMATASNPCSAAVSSATHETIAVTGTWPLSAPAPFSARTARVEATAREQAGQPGDRDGARDRRRLPDREQRRLGPRAAHDLDRHRRVLAAADGHEDTRAGSPPAARAPATRSAADGKLGRGSAASPLV